jgi:glycosyltransferase involved in cell wall biosynthesis
MRISVVLSTYNRAWDLERVLWGYAAQRDRDFQVVVADDGSGPDTAALVCRMRRESGLRLVHVRHDDRGFRKTEILNRAVAAAAGDYLLFSDGDCIPRPDLVAVHRAMARPGRFLSGGYLKLPRALSDAITVDDVVSGRVWSQRWLRAGGWRPGRRALRLLPWAGPARLLDAVTPTAALFPGNNASVWREAVERVNGFDLGAGYGSEDKMLAYRLMNAGLRGVQLRHRAVCLHLDHDRPYRDRAVERRNRALLAGLRRDGVVRAAAGLAEMGPDASLTVDGRPVYPRG